MSKPIAVVIGATGAQGGSVARALLDKYHVRTLSRDPSKPAAQALVGLGIEVIKGDIADAAACAEVLKGAEFAFLVTQFWEALDAGKEEREGKTFVDAVAAAGVKHFVFSALENVTEVTNGRLTKVAHFDGKGKIMAYIKSKGIPAVFVLLACYMENLTSFFVPRPGPDGVLALTLPDMGGKLFNHVSVAETGKVVRAIDDQWEKYVGKEIPVVSELITVDDMCKKISDVLGVQVKYNPVPNEVFASFGFPGAEDLAEMFAFYRDGPIDRDPKTTLELFPEASNIETFAKNNKDSLLKAWGLAK